MQPLKVAKRATHHPEIHRYSPTTTTLASLYLNGTLARASRPTMLTSLWCAKIMGKICRTAVASKSSHARRQTTRTENPKNYSNRDRPARKCPTVISRGNLGARPIRWQIGAQHRLTRSSMLARKRYLQVLLTTRDWQPQERKLRVQHRSDKASKSTDNNRTSYWGTFLKALSSRSNPSLRSPAPLRLNFGLELSFPVHSRLPLSLKLVWTPKQRMISTLVTSQLCQAHLVVILVRPSNSWWRLPQRKRKESNSNKSLFHRRRRKERPGKSQSRVCQK